MILAGRELRGQRPTCCYGVHVLSQADRIMDRREPVKTSRDELLVAVSFPER